MNGGMWIGLVITTGGFATFLIVCRVVEGLPRSRANVVYGVLIGGGGLLISALGLVVFAISFARASVGS